MWESHDPFIDGSIPAPRKPILAVYDDYTVELSGQRFALATPPQLDAYSRYPDERQKVRVSFDCYEILPVLAAKPKRRRASEALGLRRPK
ncbi:hypothetical protein [Mycolicibacterium aichiense]|uniref:Uncharacterized protein n=1 Tax=Mycolicibacterium aichiense TaxID=1799 RepID=A0A378VC75_9MYCO|nr:hypothetical protein [Mycolicibacterium aichiense]QFG08004.1 hypothetical protein SEA_HERBERTWM_35 [Mycobacterium phage Herbertwm]MCV7016785.1 hypothetical protein [Mycolicibacterium aichiense]SUA13996.1 Uncharacterised protein [Mycolicibacterium aichiense]SUA14426.1 Uncharacterised protein [Mycolicibacterium aichiense]BBX09431.1 hypothetical protein MAIC_42340 [Mycolicibacterium aichiense]